MDTVNVNSGAKLTKNYTAPHFSVAANLIKIHNNLSFSSESMSFNIPSLEATSELSQLYISRGEEFQLAERKLSANNLKLAIELTAFFWIKYSSLHLELFQAVVIIGWKVGVPFLGNYFKVYLSRAFGDDISNSKILPCIRPRYGSLQPVPCIPNYLLRCENRWGWRSLLCYTIFLRYEKCDFFTIFCTMCK